MSKEIKVVTFTTVIAATMSVLAVLIGGGIAWGILQTRVIALEARADDCQKTIHSKVDKEYFFNTQQAIQVDLQIIKQDIKLMLQRTRP